VRARIHCARVKEDYTRWPSNQSVSAAFRKHSDRYVEEFICTFSAQAGFKAILRQMILAESGRLEAARQK